MITVGKTWQAWTSGSEKSTEWRGFQSITDPLNVAGDEKEGIKDTPGLSSFGD